MPFLIFLGYPILEVYLWVKFISLFGWGDAFLWCLLSAIVGFWVVKTQSSEALQELRLSGQKGQLPSMRIAHRLMMSLGGVLLILPGVASDIFGALLILPGLRHIFLWFIYYRMARTAGKFFARMGPFSTFVFQFGKSATQRPSESDEIFDSPNIRDVSEAPARDQVIDVKAKVIKEGES